MDPTVIAKFLSVFERVTNLAMDIKPLIGKLESDSTFAQKAHEGLDIVHHLLDDIEGKTAAPARPTPKN